jgi:hypothetical protein
MADGWRTWILRYEIMAGRKVDRIGGKKSGMNCLFSSV